MSAGKSDSGNMAVSCQMVPDKIYTRRGASRAWKGKVFGMKKGKEVAAPPAVRDEEKATAKRPQKEAYDMAIDALVSGESVTNAAALAGVRRETLSRWLHGNPVFIAKYNVKKNEARKESLAGINSIVAQSATALRVALRHPDINPTAVVQSIMSMLPKMYAALLAQGEEETDPLNVMLSEKRRKTLAEWDILSKPLSESPWVLCRVLGLCF